MEELRLNELFGHARCQLLCLLDSLGRLADGLEGLETASAGYAYCQRQLGRSFQHGTNALADLDQYEHELSIQANSGPPKTLSEVLREKFPQQPFTFLRVPSEGEN